LVYTWIGYLWHITGEVNEVLELIDVGLYILFALKVSIRFKPHKVALFSGQNIDVNSSLKSLHDVKHIFPDCNSCHKMHSAKLATCPPLK
jgi:hypothetical protein